ncbi:pyridoxal phosphate-dependent decarboxylase family protein [Halobacillus sp. B23F22_1]|uniref:pyridoxal phosphate-dependent decarboxylase family protein n=1 Tax=Halobacillus sp. B23F22_1 TaxID=3459514 RepID=UPI00373E6F4C
MKEIQALYPSDDGNRAEREALLKQMEWIITAVDQLKDSRQLTLGQFSNTVESFYEEMVKEAIIPESPLPMDKVMDKLTQFADGHRYVNSRYVANAAPLANIPSILGNLVMVLLNGNNLWDVEGSGAAEAEVKITAMLSRLVGYDTEKSGGYTTWGGQGAVFNSLRLAIARRFPASNEEGIPRNVYVFCSELSHYSLHKSVEATGIGTNNLIKVNAKDDHSMDIHDLQEKMENVVLNGGIPLYILASTGTTDTFGIDDVKTIKEAAVELEIRHNLAPVYLHADSAMGGMYSFFNNYDFVKNPLDFSGDARETLQGYQSTFKYLHLADSLVFDFHKLGQTPYTSSLFLVKNKMNFMNVELDHDETPYVGNRSYGSYHTSYTLECSRMGSSIPIYASLVGMGVEGYQKLLANYIDVNVQFRKQLKRLPNVAITNEMSPITTFRFYPGEVQWKEEKEGQLTYDKIQEVNNYNARFADWIGNHREHVYFGSTSKQRLISPCDQAERIPVYAIKFFAISPYTTSEEAAGYVDFLAKHMEEFQQELAPV